MEAYLQAAQNWLSPEFDEATRAEVKRLMENDPKELEESFYRNLEFGTGGLRGIMGVGTNRMNKYVVAMATQGLANYMKMNFKELKQISVAISYDCRNRATIQDIASSLPRLPRRSLPQMVLRYIW